MAEVMPGWTITDEQKAVIMGKNGILMKSVAAELVPVDDATDPVGSFHAIITSPKEDRDGDELLPGEWETPLPEHIQIIGDHDNGHIMSTIGSGPPEMVGDKIHVRGTYATTGYAQDARKLINDKHVRHLSVAYREKRGEKGVSRELVNASFVNVPSNTDAIVLESKSFEGAGSAVAKEFAKAVAKELKGEGVELFGGGNAVLDRFKQLGIEIVLDEKESMITVKQNDKELGAHRFSQAPEAPPQGADHADQAEKDAAALAKGKAVAFQITSESQQFTEELENA